MPHYPYIVGALSIAAYFVVGYWFGYLILHAGPWREEVINQHRSKLAKRGIYDEQTFNQSMIVSWVLFAALWPVCLAFVIVYIVVLFVKEGRKQP